MRAVAVRRYGSADVLEEVVLPDPAPAPGEVRLRIVAAGVNPADWRLRSGQFRWFMRVGFPFVPGSDVAGVVDALGPGVTGVRVGDRVMGVRPARLGGAYADATVLPADHVAPVPAVVPFAQAAAVPLCGLTALQALRDQAGLRAGQRLLVHGAGGGVGSLAVQIGRALGAEVTAVAGVGKLGMLRDLGIHDLQDRRGDLSSLTGRFDVVLDAVAVLSNRQVMSYLRPGGTGVTVHPARGRLALDALAWARGGRRMRSVLVAERGEDLRTLAGWLENGSLRPVIEEVLPLREAARAHRRSETGQVGGKLVLAVDEELVHQADPRPDAADPTSAA